MSFSLFIHEGNEGLLAHLLHHACLGLIYLLSRRNSMSAFIPLRLGWPICRTIYNRLRTETVSAALRPTARSPSATFPLHLRRACTIRAHTAPKIRNQPQREFPRLLPFYADFRQWAKDACKELMALHLDLRKGRAFPLSQPPRPPRKPPA